MDNYNTYEGHSPEAKEITTNVMMRKVYAWMFGALAVTGLIAYYASHSDVFMDWFCSTAWAPIVMIFAELGLVLGLTSAINKLSPVVATLMFLTYAVVNGFTLSVIFFAYSVSAIATTFFVTAGTFGIMALVGSFTNRDLSKIGSVCFFALIGIIIATIVNLFLHNDVFDLIVSAIGVVVFMGLTAWDAQKIKDSLSGADYNAESAKYAVIGALSLYLDFINIFLYLLRFFGRRN